MTDMATLEQSRPDRRPPAEKIARQNKGWSGFTSRGWVQSGRNRSNPQAGGSTTSADASTVLVAGWLGQKISFRLRWWADKTQEGHHAGDRCGAGAPIG
jgi:hypothetical protein